MRVCLVYDCLYPYTVGGAERWYRNLADELVAAGHEVTYLTRAQWPAGEAPEIDAVNVVAVSPGGPLYTESGRRSIGPPLRFALGVLRHLSSHRRSYDVVHLCAFPYFSLLAARLALAGRGARTTVAVDWFEVWSREYWEGYLGAIGGRIGLLVQRACVRLTPTAFAFSRLNARRLVAEGLRRAPIMLDGLYAGRLTPRTDVPREREPVVLFAGRHIPEKRVPLMPPAIALAQTRLPGLRGLILGDGPERADVLDAIERQGLTDSVSAPGFVSAEAVDDAMTHASCHVLPSAREGYGLVVIEAAAAGTPSVVVAGPDNAAVELIEEGVNGSVAPEPTAEAIAAAILRVHAGGPQLRESTQAWFADNADRLTAAASARRVIAHYASARS